MENRKKNAEEKLPKTGLPSGFETRVIPVREVPLQEVIEVVRPLLPAEAVMTPVPGAKRLIISDRSANLNRITRLIKRLDQPRAAPPIEIIRLQNANAAEVLQVVQSMDLIPEGSSVSVDRRSNALLISGSEALRHRVRLLVDELDQQQFSKELAKKASLIKFCSRCVRKASNHQARKRLKAHIDAWTSSSKRQGMGGRIE